MTDNSIDSDVHPADDVDGERRSFLRQSVYAAYATPVITALLVEDANAALSCTGSIRRFCDQHPYIRFCRRVCG